MNKLILLLPALLLAACGEKTPVDTAASNAPKLVKALKVSRGDSPAERRYSGEVRARHETTLGFRVGGKMIERLVDAGARVKAGQVLARLDAADARLAATQAEANRALATADLKRTQDLRTKNFVSQAALDARETAEKAAAAQAQLAGNQATYTTLVADTAGVVTAVLAEPGQVVGAGQGVLRVARDGGREVAIALPEAAIAGIRVGSAATITQWVDGKTYQGRVREIAPAADVVTRTFAARVAMAGAEPGLPLGMTATVSFSRPGGERIAVPLAALFQQSQGEGGPAVWVIGADNTVTLRPVEVERYGDSGAVLKGGLNEGERIVAAGAFRLTAGETVRIAER